MKIYFCFKFFFLFLVLRISDSMGNYPQACHLINLEKERDRCYAIHTYKDGIRDQLRGIKDGLTCTGQHSSKCFPKKLQKQLDDANAFLTKIETDRDKVKAEVDNLEGLVTNLSSDQRGVSDPYQGRDLKQELEE